MREIWAWLGEWLCWAVVALSVTGLLSCRRRAVLAEAFWRLAVGLFVVHLLEGALESPSLSGHQSGSTMVDEYVAALTPLVLALGRHRPSLARALLVALLVAAAGRVLGGLSTPVMVAAGVVVGGAGIAAGTIVTEAARRTAHRWSERFWPSGSGADRPRVSSGLPR